ncbi:hypothetical protein AN639_03455 [Candidatus Epulonipiscium fishelsonii]|uniref:Uncharacterized protein n=1 Tax=Candidatus Epulonipiscium fishelsonii TaxID=77094 RepID=A0ACC8X8L4_9FIRM|nr:hypothetical protein AN396_11410 [Epulopiscium sp. SCG-B11WGA-EpuloA1]ONI41548.1 hypothetical protein AN639_03455 [Epulopiscium sp. SCG-B05WGA-EpuloA1]
MVILFLVANIILVVLYSLSINMINNHFNKIDRCIKIYNDKKVYKSDKEVEIVTNLVRDFKQLSYVKNGNIDANIFVRNKIEKARIGIFEYTKVENMALQLKWLMLLVFIINAIYNYLVENNSLVFNVELDKLILGINGIILVTTFTNSIVLNIKYKKDKLILNLEDYLVNQYDYEVAKFEQELKIRNLNKEINLLKNQISNKRMGNGNKENKKNKNNKIMEVKIVEEVATSEDKSEYAHLTDDEIIQLLKQMEWQ